MSGVERPPLPGDKVAQELGYSLSFKGGQHSFATYSKGALSLTVQNDGKAYVSAQYKLVTITSRPFSFPNKNFELFERQVLHVISAAEAL